MAKKRNPSRRKKKLKKGRKNNLFNGSLFKTFAGIAILLLLVALAGLLAHYLVPLGKPPRLTTAPGKSLPTAKEPIAKIPTFEIYPKREISPAKKPITASPPDKIRLPLVAIIIDDLGYDRKIAEKLSEIEAAFTFSILPYSPFQDSIANLSKAKGLEIMLHLPMEPIEYPAVNPGPGTLLTSMTPDELIRQLKENLEAVPFVKGVNNHMGSRMTAESSQMYQIFSVLKERNLYFIDSRTSAQTLCKPSARLFQIPFAQRDVFLDHLQDAEFIRKQIKELVSVARLNGYAIGIGHPHAITYEILRKMLPVVQKEVKLVAASEIARPVE